MLKDIIDKPEAPYGLIWLLIFIYAALVAFFIQLIALPYIVPGWHWGNGLIIGMDGCWFHELAVEMSESIRMNGWQEWQLRPEGQAPAGIAAAIYALTVPKPWTIIPLNAVLHASAAVMIMLIIQRFKVRWQYAAASALPFIFYPSAMTWYTQIHKDGIFILGLLIFLYGWILLAEEVINTRNLKTVIKPYLFILAGAALVWVVRPYGVQMMQGLSILMAGGLILFGLVQVKKLPGSLVRRLIITPLLLLILIVSITPFTRGGYEIDANTVSKPQITSTVKQRDWQQTLPPRADNLFRTLASLRNGLIEGYPDAESNIDTHVRFHSAADFVLYFPRAVEIAFLAPFPNMWINNGSAVNSSFIRKISGIEMLGIYFALVCAALSFKKWRKIPAWWVLIFFCSSMMVIYVYINVNIGTLYRMRYGFIMTITALGLAYLLNELLFRADKGELDKGTVLLSDKPGQTEEPSPCLPLSTSVVSDDSPGGRRF